MGNKDVAKLAQRVTALVEQGLDVAEAYAVANGGTARAGREYAKAMDKHAKEVRRHQERTAERRRDSVVLTAASGATAVLGIIDVAAADVRDPRRPVDVAGGRGVCAP